jgi:hypothetical protein
MMNQSSLAPLFEHARSWGKKDPGTWSYKMEEQYYHPTLLGFVMSERRRVKVENLTDLFVSQKSLRRKRDAVKVLKGYIWRRRRARFLMQENIVRYVIDHTSEAWKIWRKFSMREIAVREIQRIIRGYMGKTEPLGGLLGLRAEEAQEGALGVGEQGNDRRCQVHSRPVSKTPSSAKGPPAKGQTGEGRYH